MTPRSLRKKFPKDYFRTKALDESGAALAIALMVLVILTLLGSASIMTSITEVEIAANEKQYQMVFYASDGGSDLSPRIIRDTIALHDEPTYDGGNVVVVDGLLDELMKFGTADDNPSDGPQDDPDIRIPALTNSLSVRIDVDRGNTLSLPGGAREMGSGYEGIGGGASGGTAVMYDIRSESQGSRNSSTNINTKYLYVIGVGG